MMRDQLMRQAARIAINRTVAGVHFPVDSIAGQALGFKLADYVIARCKPPTTSTPYVPWRFNGQMVHGQQDFDFRMQYHTPTGNTNTVAFIDTETSHGIPSSPALAWLWAKAIAEWT